MSPTQITPEIVKADATIRLAAKPRVAVDVNDVMRDQLEFLIEHAQNGVCRCEQCERYLRARRLLLTELFPESPEVTVLQKRASAA